MKRNPNSVRPLYKHFKMPKKAGKRFHIRFKRSFTNFYEKHMHSGYLYGEHRIIEKYYHRPKFDNNLFPLLYQISKSLGTRIIFREILYDDQPSRALSCVGEEPLVDLNMHIITYLCEAFKQVEENLRAEKTISNKIHSLKNKKGETIHAKTYASNMKVKHINSCLIFIKDLLRKDDYKLVMILIKDRTDEWILEMLKLDRKNYKVNHNNISLYETHSKNYYKNRVLSE